MMPNTTVCDAPERPPAVIGGALGSLQALMRMLAEGWRIEPPVLARLSWAQRHSGDIAYHIILTRAPQRSLIVIPATPELDSFFAELNVPIV
jgi:hypothetical protein